MIRVRTLYVWCSLLAALLLAACGSPVTTDSGQAQPSASVVGQASSSARAVEAAPAETAAASVALQAPTVAETSTVGAVYPVTIKDGLEREVVLNAAPKRIVSLAPSNTEILFAVGAGDQVVGVTKFCNFPEAAKNREQIGGFSAKTISVEKIVALKPDLVIAGDEGHQPVIDALQQLNIPVMALKANSFDDVYANITLVGQTTDHVGEAQRVMSEMQQRVDAIKTQAATIPQEQRVKVFYEVFDEPLMTAGPATFIGQMIEFVGGINTFADVSEEYPKISAEEVVARNPQVIVGPDSHGDKLTVDTIKQRPGWAEIDAVKAGRIVTVDGDLVSRPGPRLAEAVEILAPALYPDVFK